MSDYRYISSGGAEFDLNQRNLYTASFNSLRSYEWNAVIESDVLFGFETRRNIEKQLQLQYHNSDRAEFLRFKEELYEAFAEDIRNNSPGRFYVRDYYARGFVRGEAIETYDTRHKLWISTIPILFPDELWTKEVSSHIITESNPEVTDTIEEFRWGYYPFTYSDDNKRKEIVNNSTQPSPFRLSIYGPCENPAIRINGNLYNVSVSLESGETLIIDSQTKSITTIDYAGNETNCLQYRNDSNGNDVFKRLPVGELVFQFQDIPKFAITIFDERNAPPWI